MFAYPVPAPGAFRRQNGKERGVEPLSLDSAFFILCFLPLSVVLNYLLKGVRARNLLLLILSLLFCAFGSLPGLALLLAAALVNYTFGLLICRYPKGAGALAAAAVVLDLAFLAAFKYLSFFVSLFLPLLQSSWPGLGIAAPLGISFFTFKCISYIVDTKRDAACGTRNFPRLLLYISFFPQLAAGPIARFSDFRPQLEARPRSAEDLGFGLRRFVLGLGKKLILAGAAARIADPIFAQGAPLNAALGWLGAAAYLMQIYFDFSGYSDMAIGLGRILGFRTQENFEDPYTAESITDFWRRWHISLSLWFRDYLYIPLGGNRKGRGRTALNKFIVFFLCGLWHGANWTFVLWGLWHGLFSALESLGVIQIPRLKKSLPGKVLCHVYALLAVCLGFVMFRAETLAGGWRVLSAMFGAFPAAAQAAAALRSVLSPVNGLGLALCMALCIPWKKRLPGAAAALTEGKLRLVGYGFCVLVLAACLAELAAGGFAPFIYVRF